MTLHVALNKFKSRHQFQQVACQEIRCYIQSSQGLSLKVCIFYGTELILELDLSLPLLGRHLEPPLAVTL